MEWAQEVFETRPDGRLTRGKVPKPNWWRCSICSCARISIPFGTDMPDVNTHRSKKTAHRTAKKQVQERLGKFSGSWGSRSQLMEVSHFFLWMDPSVFWYTGSPWECVIRKANIIKNSGETHPQWTREYSPNRAGGEEEYIMDLLSLWTEYYDLGLVGTQIGFRIDEWRQNKNRTRNGEDMRHSVLPSRKP